VFSRQLSAEEGYAQAAEDVSRLALRNIAEHPQLAPILKTLSVLNSEKSKQSA
jgi:hypothetical protein